MSRETSTSEEKESFREVWKEFLLGKKSIRDVLSHSEFLRRGRFICSRIVRDTSYDKSYDASNDAEDIFLEACAKVLEFEDEFKARDTRDVKAFFWWFDTIARNIFYKAIREQNAQDKLLMQRLFALHDFGVLHPAEEPREAAARARRTPAETLAEIAALPLEGEADAFSGRDHDSVLYPRK